MSHVHHARFGLVAFAAWRAAHLSGLIPIRGDGKCPKTDSRYRYRIRKCNTHPCNGDEICIAKQDLVIAIDGSGSVREEGFKTLQRFALTLLEKYKGEYYGMEDMRVGIVQFGNGEIL